MIENALIISQNIFVLKISTKIERPSTIVFFLPVLLSHYTSQSQQEVNNIAIDGVAKNIF